MRSLGQDAFDPEYGLMVASFENGNETLCSIKCVEFLD
jgi:hypothetical protein